MFVSKGEHWDKNLTSAMGEISRGHRGFLESVRVIINYAI